MSKYGFKYSPAREWKNIKTGAKGIKPLDENEWFDTYDECVNSKYFKDNPNEYALVNLKGTDFIVWDFDDTSNERQAMLLSGYSKENYLFEKTITIDGEKHPCSAHLWFSTRNNNNEKYTTKHLKGFEFDVLGNKSCTWVGLKGTKYNGWYPDLIDPSKICRFGEFEEGQLERNFRLEKPLYPKKNTSTNVSLDLNNIVATDWSEFIEHQDTTVIDNVLFRFGETLERDNKKRQDEGLSKEEYWPVWTYCKNTNREVNFFKNCRRTKDSTNYAYSGDCYLGLFINLLKRLSPDFKLVEIKEYSWIGLMNSNSKYLDKDIVSQVFNSPERYSLLVSNCGSGKTTGIIDYCLNHPDKSFSIVAPRTTVTVNYRDRIIKMLNEMWKALPIDVKLRHQMNGTSIYDRVVFSENKDGKRLYFKYNHIQKKFEEIPYGSLPENAIKMFTVQFLETIGDGASMFQNDILIVDEFHDTTISGEYSIAVENGNKKFFFEYFHKVIFMTGTPNKAIIHQIRGRIPDMVNYRVDGIDRKVKIIVYQPNEKLINYGNMINIITLRLAWQKSTTTYVVWNDKIALDAIESQCRASGVDIVKIYHGNPLKSLEQLKDKSVIGTISMSSSFDLDNRDSCIINNVSNTADIIQIINRYRGGEPIDVFINSNQDFNTNFWFNYNVEIIDNKILEKNENLNKTILKIKKENEYKDKDGYISPIKRGATQYKEHLTNMDLKHFIEDNNINGDIQELIIGNPLPIHDKINMRGKCTLKLSGVDGDVQLPYSIVNLLNSFDPNNNRYYVKGGDNLIDNKNRLNSQLNYVRNNTPREMWEDKEHRFSFERDKAKGKAWNKPYTTIQRSNWVEFVIQVQGKPSKVKNPKRYIDEIMKMPNVVDGWKDLPPDFLG